MKSQTYALLDPLMRNFLAFEKERLHGRKKDLIQANAKCGGSDRGCVFRGQVISHLKPYQIRGNPLTPLDESLHEQGEILIQNLATLEADEQRMRQSFGVVISRCQDRQDLRDALPEQLVQEIPELARLPRKREEGFLLAEHPLLKSQYDRAVTLGLKYAANRLIY